MGATKRAGSGDRTSGKSVVDLRSDTLTKPSAEMRKAMAAAEVGDDVYGEDPTALELEARVAELLGKEAALFVPSGSMGNQIALMLHCRRGDSVVVGEGTHCMVYEAGAAAALAGVQFSVAGKGGLFSPAELEAAFIPDHVSASRSRLVVLENTHNRAGGRVFPQPELEEVARRARALGLAVHMDGARLWNAAAATGLALSVLAAPADTVSVCFSKGLGAPVGSALLGSRELVREARRLRKLLGGGMRQVGVLCAAALFALEHHRDRLQEDHALARRLAHGLVGLAGLRVDPETVDTNIVNIDISGLAAGAMVSRLAENGVLVNAVGQFRLRAVTHRDLEIRDIDAALDGFARSV
ncbi:MAG: GntG family PLP-dependent aldolase [Myxococcales bacterium]